MTELKYVNFYNSALKEGNTNGIWVEKRNIIIEWNNNNVGFYLTPMFDTRTEGSTYNRLIIDGGRVTNDLDNESIEQLGLEGIKMEVIAVTTNIDTVKSITLENCKFEGGLTSDFDSWLRQRNDEELKTIFKETNANFQQIYYVDAKDILLHNLQGRYIWVLVIFTAHISPPPYYKLNGIRLEFPKHSFLDYFPEIYHPGKSEKDDFFTRYIAIFQSLFLDEERNVDNIPKRLDYNLASDSDVKNLAEWLGIDNSHGLFSIDDLRKIIRESELFQGRKGTMTALEAIFELLIGEKPKIKECFKCRKSESMCEEYIDRGFCIEQYRDLGRKQKQIIAEYFPLNAIIRRDKIVDSEIKERILGQAILESDSDMK